MVSTTTHIGTAAISISQCVANIYMMMIHANMHVCVAQEVTAVKKKKREIICTFVGHLYFFISASAL